MTPIKGKALQSPLKITGANQKSEPKTEIKVYSNIV